MPGSEVSAANSGLRIGGRICRQSARQSKGLKERRFRLLTAPQRSFIPQPLRDPSPARGDIPRARREGCDSGDGKTALESEGQLDIRRRRLLYRSEHRGNKENDILLGQFARAHVMAFDAAQLDQYEALLEESDNDIFDWAAGRSAVPADKDTSVLRMVLSFKVRF
ncbi:MAG: succinate dehydrogenase assembly factor 2 [Alphaproteobacteria bacterium]|nr:succinate dehydrogenase assembly factor 2 [Alphaproteobacteria bacterium]